MATAQSPVILDSTFQSLIGETNTLLNEQNTWLASLAAGAGTGSDVTYADFARIVRADRGADVFSIGNQINANFTDAYSGTTYTMPWNITHFKYVELQDGSIVPGCVLQSHYATPYALPFGTRQAFCSADSLELVAGTTYAILIGATWGKFTKDKYFTFTPESAIPATYQLVFASDLYSNDPDGTTINVFSGFSSTTIEQTMTISVVDSIDENVTLIGTLGTTFGDDLSTIYTATYGYNRYSYSVWRQHLNSKAAAGSWCTAKTKWDRPPSALSTRQGFMAGFDSDFLAMLKPVKVTTALNTVTDSSIGTSEDTYDTFFLPSLEEEFITPQLAGVEGEAWDYWKEACGRTTTTPWYTTYANGGQPITYALENQTSAQYVRLRSAIRGRAYSACCVYSSGYVGHGDYATNEFRCAPACVVC